MKKNTVDCIDCYHYYNASGMYGCRSYCKIHETNKEDCEHFIDKKDKVKQCIYNLEQELNIFSRSMRKKITETENSIQRYFDILKRELEC